MIAPSTATYTSTALHHTTVGARSPLGHLFASFPDAYATMQAPGSASKYQREKVDDPAHPGDPEKRILLPLTNTVLRDHLVGMITVACALTNANGMARAACGDIDHGGEEDVLKVWRAALARNLKAFAFVSKAANGHDGGYVWIVYDQDYEAIRLRLLINELYATAGVIGEARTNRADTRLPFGYHLYSMTYGTMHAPDGKVYELDNADERREALRLFSRTTNDQAPPEVKRAEPISRPAGAGSAIDTTELKNLRIKADGINARLQAARHPDHRLPSSEHRALVDLLKATNEASTRSTPPLYNRAYTCGNILESHGAPLIRSDSQYDWYGPLPGDTHSNPKSPKHKVDRATGRCFGLSPNCRIGNDTKGHDPLSLTAALDHNGDIAAAIKAAADILAPFTPVVNVLDATPLPEAPVGTTPEQRKAAADAKRRQREAQRAHAAAVRDAAIERANTDERLVNSQGRGTNALTTLMALLDFMGLKTWCRPTVETLAAHIGCSESYVQKGLAKLEACHYIITSDKVNPRTGEVYRGGCKIDTPIRTLVDYTKRTRNLDAVDGIATQQTDETGVYAETPQTDETAHEYTHVLVGPCAS